jgi:Reverse transcriptase (RNA-dependent DNA polymerase)/gag-polypeptide of LTR copia-type/Integrase core domain/GAG-pre-integrase domain
MNANANAAGAPQAPQQAQQQVAQGQNVQQPVQQQQLAQAQNATLTSAKKAPRMSQFLHFEVYRRTVELYFQQYHVLQVVDGTTPRPPPNDPTLHQWEERDIFARSCLLQGVGKDDHEHIIEAQTANDMWTALINYKTKRGHANYLNILRKLYRMEHQKGSDVEKWFMEMKRLRRTLADFNQPIIDDEFARVLQMGLSTSHRELIRHFETQVRLGNPPPTSEEVIQAVLIDQEASRQMKQETVHSHTRRQGFDDRRIMHIQGRKRFDNRKNVKPRGQCHLCGKEGHWKRNCRLNIPGYSRQQPPPRQRVMMRDNGNPPQYFPQRNDDQQQTYNTSRAANPEFRRWQPKRAMNQRNDIYMLRTVHPDENAPPPAQRSTRMRATRPVTRDYNWIFDSGTDVHVTYAEALMTDVHHDDQTFEGWDGQMANADLVGTAQFAVEEEYTGDIIRMELQGVRLVHTATNNLLSMCRLIQSDWHIHFNVVCPGVQEMYITQGNKRVNLVYDGSFFRLHCYSLRSARTYTRRAMTPKASGHGLQSSFFTINALQTVGSFDTVHRWHHRMAHINYRAIAEMAQQGKAKGMNIQQGEPVPHTCDDCFTCALAKRKRMTYKHPSPDRAIIPNQKLMADICYVNIPTGGGNRHFFLVQDEASRYKWGFLVKTKGQATYYAQDLITRLISHDHKVQLFASDQGKELVNRAMHDFLEAKGIYYEWTNPYSPEENDLVEKMNDIVMTKMRAIMTAADMPESLWGEAFNFVIDVDNVSPSKALHGDTPYYRYFGSVPDLCHLRTWATLVLVFVPKHQRANKLAAPARPALFLGYPKHCIGYRLLCLVTGKIIERRDVKFYEHLTVPRAFVTKLLTHQIGADAHHPNVPLIDFPVVGSVMARLEALDMQEVQRSHYGPTLHEGSGLILTDHPHFVPTDAAHSRRPSSLGASGTYLQPWAGGPLRTGASVAMSSVRRDDDRNGTHNHGVARSTNLGTSDDEENLITGVTTLTCTQCAIGDISTSCADLREHAALTLHHNRPSSVGVSGTIDTNSQVPTRHRQSLTSSSNSNDALFDTLDGDSFEDSFDASNTRDSPADYTTDVEQEGTVDNDSDNQDTDIVPRLGPMTMSLLDAGGWITSDDDTMSMTTHPSDQNELSEELDTSSTQGDDQDVSPTQEDGLSHTIRRSTRQRQTNTRLAGYDVDIPPSLQPAHIINHLQAANDNPSSLREALSSPDAPRWIEAMNIEMDQLMKNDTWDLVERVSNASVLSCRWVLVKKRDEKGVIVRYKARLTIRGFEQRFGVNYWETYASVVRPESMKLLLVVAMNKGYECRHLDFVTAFLNGPIDVDVYMEQPEGYDDNSGRVCKLKKGLYGLKQAPRLWNETLNEFMQTLGFQRMMVDEGVYRRVQNNEELLVSVYVDDLLVLGKTSHIDQLVHELKMKFEVKDLGTVKHVLGMEVTYVPFKYVMLSQGAYINRILEVFGMDQSKPVVTPEVPGQAPTTPTKPYGPEVNDPRCKYQAIVGSLQYLVSCTRPDIANAVRVLSKFNSCYTNEHLMMAKRVLRYLKGTTNYGLVYRADPSQSTTLHFDAYADADLGNDMDTRRSTSGFILQVNGCTIAAKSKLQNVAVDSTCSAEFVAANFCATEIVWAHNLCKQLEWSFDKTTLYQDNTSAIAVIKSVGKHHKSRGVDLKLHRIRDLARQGVFEVVYCPTDDMVADILTKSLPGPKFQAHRERMNIENIMSVTEIKKRRLFSNKKA